MTVLQVAQFCRSEVQIQGLRRALVPPKAPGADPPCLLQLLGAPGIPGCGHIPPASVSPPHGLLLWVVFSSDLSKEPIGFQTLPNPGQSPLENFNYICKGPISK